MIKIKDVNGNVRLEVELCGSDTYDFQLMTKDDVTLHFSRSEYIVFQLGDYVDFLGETDYPILSRWGRRFELTEKEYKPAYNKTTGGYDYALTLQADYWGWKNKIFRYSPDFGGREASFSLTGTPDIFLDLFIENLDAFGFKYRGVSYDYSIASDYIGKNIALSFTGTSLIDALGMICAALDPDGKSCEWVIREGYIYIGKCSNLDGEDGTRTLVIGDNLESVGIQSNSSSYANRLYAFGSDKNLSERYRKEVILTVDELGSGSYLGETRTTFRDTTRKIACDVFNREFVPGNRVPARFSLPDTQVDGFTATFATSVNAAAARIATPLDSRNSCGSRDVHVDTGIDFSYGGTAEIDMGTLQISAVRSAYGSIRRYYVNVQVDLETKSGGEYTFRKQLAYTGASAENYVAALDLGTATVRESDVVSGKLSLRYIVSLYAYPVAGTPHYVTAAPAYDVTKPLQMYDDSVSSPSNTSISGTRTVRGKDGVAHEVRIGRYPESTGGVYDWNFTDNSAFLVYRNGNEYVSNTNCRTYAVEYDSEVGVSMNVTVSGISVTQTNHAVRTTLAVLNNDNSVKGYVTAVLNADNYCHDKEESLYFTLLEDFLFDGTYTPQAGDRLALYYFRDSAGDIVKTGARKVRDYSKAKVPVGYFTADMDEHLYGVAERRLMLPTVPVYRTEDGVITYDEYTGGTANARVYDGSGKIESVSGLKERQYVEDLVVFEDVFPTFTGVVESPEGETVVEVERKDEDEKFTAFQILDTTLKNFKTDYIVDDSLYITFCDVEKLGVEHGGGRLNGLTFKLLLQSTGESGTVFEIDRNDTYMIPLPDKTSGMYPRVGDGYVITGLDTTVYEGDALTEEAELELVRVSLLYAGYRDVDTKTYSCRLMAGYAKSQLESGRFFELGNVTSVRTDSLKIAESRIIGGTFRLDIPWDNPTVTVGESSAFSRIGELSDSIKGLAFSSASTNVVGGSRRGVEIIKSGDRRSETDENVYSALRSKKEIEKLLRKDRDDETEYTITGKNLVARDTAQSRYLDVLRDASVRGGLAVTGESNLMGVTKSGTPQTLADRQVVHKVFGGTEWGNREFEAGSTGAKVWKERDGWHAQADYLYITKKFTAKTMEIMHEQHIKGSFVISPADCTADLVEETRDENGNITHWTVYFLAEDPETERKIYNTWAVGDLARCQTVNLSGAGTYENFSNIYWWRQVWDVSSAPVEIQGNKYHYIRFLNDPDYCDEGSDAPRQYDEIVQMGHVSDPSRQGVIMLTSVVNGEMANVPFIRIYKGVGSEAYDNAGNLVRSKFQLPKARIDLNPFDPNLDVSQLTITAGGDTKSIEDYINEVEGEGLMVIYGDSAAAPTTTDEFIWNCLEMLGLETRDEMVGAFYITTEWRIWQFQDDLTWKEATDTNLRDILGEFQEQRQVLDAIMDDGCVTDNEKPDLQRILIEWNGKFTDIRSRYLATYSTAQSCTAAYNSLNSSYATLQSYMLALGVTQRGITPGTVWFSGSAPDASAVSADFTRTELADMLSQTQRAYTALAEAMEAYGLSLVDGKYEQQREILDDIMNDGCVTDNEKFNLQILLREWISRNSDVTGSYVAPFNGLSACQQLYASFVSVYSRFAGYMSEIGVQGNTLTGGTKWFHGEDKAAASTELSFTRQQMNDSLVALQQAYDAFFEFIDLYRLSELDDKYIEQQQVLDDIMSDDCVTDNEKPELQKIRLEWQGLYQSAVGRFVPPYSEDLGTGGCYYCFGEFRQAYDTLIGYLTEIGVNASTVSPGTKWFRGSSNIPSGASVLTFTKAQMNSLLVSIQKKYEAYNTALEDYKVAEAVEAAETNTQDYIQENIDDILRNTGGDIIRGIIDDYADGALYPKSHFNVFRESIQAYTEFLDPIRGAAGNSGLLTYLDETFLGTNTVLFRKDSNGNVVRFIAYEDGRPVKLKTYNGTVSRFAYEDGEWTYSAGGVLVADVNGEIAAASIFPNVDVYDADTRQRIATKPGGVPVVENYNDSGVVTKTGFASLFARAVDEHDNLVTQADLSAIVERDANGNWVSKANISADKVFLTSGDRRLGNYVSLDGNTGNMTLHDLYAHDITLEGVLNNLVQTITAANLHEYGKVFTNDFWLDPLRCGTILRFGLTGLKIWLPTAYAEYAYNSGGKQTWYTVINGWHAGEVGEAGVPFTANELRQCVGKRFYLLPQSEGLSFAVTGAGDMPMLFRKQKNYLSGSYSSADSSGDGIGRTNSRKAWDDMVAGGIYKEETVVIPALYGELVPGGGTYMVILECHMGYYNSHECIYWTVEESFAPLPDAEYHSTEEAEDDIMG